MNYNHIHIYAKRMPGVTKISAYYVIASFIAIFCENLYISTLLQLF